MGNFNLKTTCQLKATCQLTVALLLYSLLFSCFSVNNQYYTIEGCHVAQHEELFQPEGIIGLNFLSTGIVG